MEILEINIDKISPDKHQPRTSIDELDLREMAKSIITEGVINPIEVDKRYVIITGERRWRASKLAGLKRVPVKVLDMSDDDRFMRQVIENIHHNTMSDWDTANALRKLINDYFQPPKVILTKGQPATGITWLSEKTGKSLGYISDKLKILEASPAFQEAVKKQDITGEHITIINSVPEKYRKEFERKVLKHEIPTRSSARELRSAIKREEGNPDKVKKLLSIDYSKYKRVGDAENVITKISPRNEPADRIAKTYEPSQEISEIAESLKEWVRNNPREDIGAVHLPRVVINMNFIKSLLEEWFANKKLLK